MSNEFEGKYRIINLYKGEIYTNKGYELGIDYRLDKCYYLDENLHRDDGPAVIYSSGSKEWYLNDKQYSEEEYYIIQKICSHCNTKFNTLNDLMQHYKSEQIKYPELNVFFQEKIDSIYIQFIK